MPVALAPTTRPARPPTCRLEPFDPTYATLVASWIRNEREALWLAPKTRPPLTSTIVRAWRRPRHNTFQLVTAPGEPPIAYGELNPLDAAAGHYWLGHLIVAAEWRRRGIGLALTRALLHRAFTRYAARKVSLVVFPDNTPAIACYRAAGLISSGYEVHRSQPYGRRLRLLRMSITRQS